MEPNDIQAVVNDAIAKAATPQPPVMTGYAKQLDALRVSSQTQVTKHRFLFRMFGIPCFPRKELVLITGKKKCGKTYFSSILMTLGQCKQLLCMQRAEENPYKSLWIDTEQSDDTTKEILVDRIMPLVDRSLAEAGEAPFSLDDELEYYYALNLRCVPWNERLQLIEAAIRKIHPDLVIIDGIRDVVDDINNGILAQEIIESLMKLAAENDCCIVSVLHQNKAAEDRTPRGALGTEYGHKGFEEWEMKKEIESGMVVFTVAQTATRKYDITNKMQFTIEPETGLPVALTDEQQLALEQAQSGAAKPKTPARTLNRDYLLPNNLIDGAKAFGEILADGAEMRYSVLRDRFMNLVGTDNDNRFKGCLGEALKRGILTRTDVDPYTFTYRLAAVPAEV